MAENNRDQDHRKVSLPIMTGYGAGQIGAQIFRDTPAVLLPIFMTTMLGIPAWLSGFVILIPKLWVIVCDPLVGVWSDRLKESKGRTPFLWAGSLLTSIGFLALFTILDYGDPLTAAICVCLIFFVSSTGFSLYSVPYLAMASELSPDRHERTRIMAYRMIATMGGVVLGVGVAQPLVFQLGGGAKGWHTMAIVFSILCLATMVIPAIVLRRTRLLSSGEPPARILDQLSAVFANKPFSILLATTFVQGIGQASGYTVLGFYYLYVLGQVSIIPQMIMCLAAGSFLSQPLFFWLSRVFGKERCYVAASLGWVAVTCTWFYVYPGSPVLFHLPLLGEVTEQGALVLLRAFVLGIVNSGFLLLSYSMLTDTVDLQRRTKGAANEGVFSGLFTAAEKLAFALGPVIAGLVMSAYGFQSSTGGAMEQSEQAVTGIKLLYSFIPVGTQILSLVIFAFYRLDPSILDDDHKALKPSDVPGAVNLATAHD